MNPVLLKPSSDVGSQVIVNGQPVGNMKVSEYVAYKKEIWTKVCRAYDSLAGEHDVLLLEGAGSPGEVNLKAHDIVNMKMARYAEARGLLVGDIDRGGVYASFIGHFEVMAPWERELVAGFVVNRFRGDASLLQDAHEYLLDHTGKPVLGVVPYLADLGLPQEDSVSFKAGLFTGKRPVGSHVEVVLIDLPHISNFTDVEPFFEEQDVYLRIVDRHEQLGCPDAVILPGSKNVPADMAWLHKNNLAKAIVGHVRGGLAMVVVVSEMLFSGISGSSVADASALGSVMIPAMKRSGYSNEHSVSIITAASGAGMLIPPCLVMIVMASISDQSVAALFFGGLLPGT